MIKLDHLTIFVSDVQRSCAWYMQHFGFTLEFEVPERKTVALQDDSDLTLFLEERPDPPPAPSCILTFQVEDVEAKHRQLAAAGVPFVNAPQKLFWGYGAELRDPDGYMINVWDERSMREKGGSS